MTSDRLDDFDRLLRSHGDSTGCWCMWFIRPVTEYHAAGDAGNRSAFSELVATDPVPMGHLAFDGDDPAGWCASGPRRRYTRILKALTLRGRDKAEDESVWLVPCFLIAPEARGRGVATALLGHAVESARNDGATAIEGFPLAGSRRRSGGADFMTGTETLFASCGFEPVRRPSDNRVVMRLDLTG